MLRETYRDFESLFSAISEQGFDAYEWQKKLGEKVACGNRIIRIPTGFGKTLGVLAAWLWHRVCNNEDGWPRRLVWCLPMRVLVEQTEHEVRAALDRLGLLWSGPGHHHGKVGVHRLMGGVAAEQWHVYPECDAVLIGTQDMLLSRAINRGYASHRARWPMEFGLLNQDALWVMDEVQLMDVGLATSGQLQAFRDEDQSEGRSLRPCFTWWMSATLQKSWLKKSPDTTGLVADLSQNQHFIAPAERKGHLWDQVSKPLEVKQYSNTRALAADVSQKHRDGGCGREGPTLVILNTVKRALEVWTVLRRDKALTSTSADIRLAHSRFRPIERRNWREQFLNREMCVSGTNRIIVSTQVVEAGVDISASLLVTELAPWPSMVQRLGRVARWGGSGQIIVADFQHVTDAKAAPYSLAELEASREACAALPDAGPLHLESYEDQHKAKALLDRLYPYEPKHLLLRHELDELFDTSPDLSGADIDISRFIRSGDERDVQVFWRKVSDDAPSLSIRPEQNELCSVPFLQAREWLCKSGSNDLKPGVRAWVWDWLERRWCGIKRRELYPGQVVLVESGVGGYRGDAGWDPKSDVPVEPVHSSTENSNASRSCWVMSADQSGWEPGEHRMPSLRPEEYADAAETDESMSITEGWQTIADHGLQVGLEAENIALEVVPDFAGLLHLAGRWHDLGKAHPAFQGCIQASDRPQRDDIAKAPDRAWPRDRRDYYRIDDDEQRSGFRHELASTLGLFGVLQRRQPQHEALLGPWAEWLAAMPDMQETGHPAGGLGDTGITEIEQEVLDLGAEDFDLLAYLVCSHHGKVRMTWHASPAGQASEDPRLRIRGVRSGDILPPLLLAAADGDIHTLPAMSLDLSPSEAGLSPKTGKSWTERVLDLLGRFGPFTLAWLEALVRSADQRASAQPVTDKLLERKEADDAGKGLDASHREVEKSDARGASSSPLGSDSPPRREFNGDGGRASGRDMDSGTARPPYSATRYIETKAGILSYQELAPLLAERVAETALAIADRKFASLPFQDLLLEIHRCICAGLTPEMAGRWRVREVRVGDHQPPPHWQVPMLMHEYGADLAARLADPEAGNSECLIDDLAFAEGRLLNIHPFEDFNGRVSRLFLVELLYRLELPAIDPAASSEEQATRYFAALRAYDRRDPGPLSAVWRERFAQSTPR